MIIHPKCFKSDHNSKKLIHVSCFILIQYIGGNESAEGTEISPSLNSGVKEASANTPGKFGI